MKKLISIILVANMIVTVGAPVAGPNDTVPATQSVAMDTGQMDSIVGGIDFLCGVAVTGIVGVATVGAYYASVATGGALAWWAFEWVVASVGLYGACRE